MSDLNLSPYAVKLRFYLGGAHYYTVTRPDGAVVTIETDDDLASCLNAAYAKGVEDERARVRSAIIKADDDEFGWADEPGPFATVERDHRQDAINLLVSTYAFDAALADRLVTNGIWRPAAFEGCLSRDLVDLGFTQAEADDIMSKVNPS